MICNGCGNQAARRVRITQEYEICDACGLQGTVTIPDVYFDKPYLDPHLIDPKDRSQKNGVWIESKRHKAEIMKRLGVREVGDKVRGYRPWDKFAMRRERDLGRQPDVRG